MNHTPSPFRRQALALAVGAIVGVASNLSFANESLNQSYVDGLQNEVEVFVRLSTPSVAEINAQSLSTSGRFASRAAQQAQAAAVDAEQAAFRNQLASFGATELSSQRVGANGLRVNVAQGQIEALRSLPGVRSVGKVERHEVNNVTSAPWIGSAAVNALGLSGEGISIGIIDTGVDYTHANFGGPGTVAAYTGNNRNIIEPGTFPTAKVVGGFDFAGPTYNANVAGSVPTPDPDPLDVNGHGSHVAGSAAGLGVAGSVGQGVAPAASIYALKVFGDGGGSTNLTSLAIEWAMDPNGDGDMSDHLDVINMSLGSPFGEPADPSAISADNASNVGIIVVASAGNEGNLPYITGAPGVGHGVISTAANTPGGRPFATLTVDAPAGVAGAKYNEEGTSPARVSSVAPLTDTVVRGVPIDGCTPFTNAAAISGNIVLVQRGGVPAACSFAIKAQNALAAGARAMLAFNNVAGDPIVMGAITAAIPGVMISLADGAAIAAVATTDAASPVTATFGFGPDSTKADRIASFSSRGPGEGGSGFKPDLSAPGVGIVSTGVGSGTGSRNLQGTSMAAPHVAGAAALMHQKFPHLQPYTIKALLQNSTVDGNPAAGGDTSLSRHGVGAVRIDRAIALSSFVLPGGVSFGRINPTTTTSRSETVYLENMASGNRTFTATHVANATVPGATVTCPNPVTVGSYRGKYVSIKISYNPKASADAGVFDNASHSQREVGGWCVFSDGKDTLRVGYLAVVDPASNMIAQPGSGSFGVDVKNKGPAIGLAEGFTLAASGSTGVSDSYATIAKVGARRGDVAAYGGDVIEFGIEVGKIYEHTSNVDLDIFVDVDSNGTEDVVLRARDWTAFQTTGTLGTYVAAQFVIGGAGFLDWIVNTWDHNDRVLIVPFSLNTFGGLIDSNFSYRMVITDRQGNSSQQTGTIDLANEIVPDLNSFGLAAGESVHVNVSGGSGNMLWLFPNNHSDYQDATTYTTPGGHGSTQE